jgi:hypothetical protein
MLKGITTETSCTLYKGQFLAIASMNLRYLAQYYALSESPDTLYAKLRRIWEKRISEKNKDKNPNKVHLLFAELPGKLPKCSHSSLPLIVTTNYDDLLERAFDQVRQPYDVVYYVANGEQGQYKHKRYGEDRARVIEDPKNYLDLPLPSPITSPIKSSSEPHPIILKLYGTWEDQFVITQDNLNFFASNWIDNLPNTLISTIRQATILFLGYSPSDSELQLIVNRFWSKTSGSEREKLGRHSCLVHQSSPGDLEKKVWQGRGVELLLFDHSLSLEDFATYFESEIEEAIEKW